MDRRQYLHLITASGVVGVAGCLGDDDSSGDTSSSTTNSTDEQSSEGDRVHELTDVAGRTVEVPTTPEGIVAVNPGALRLVAQFEATDLVVGVESDETDWRQEVPYNMTNPELSSQTVIGGQGGDAENIIAVEPDVVLSAGSQDELDTLEQQTGIPTVGVTSGQLIDLGEPLLESVWKIVGDALDRDERASELVAFLENVRNDLEERVAGADETPLESYVAGVSFRGGQGFEATRPRFAPFDLLGGANNVAADIEFSDIPHVTISAEQLIQWDPDVIFVDRTNLERVMNEIRENPAYADLTAVSEGNIHGLLPHAQYGLNHSNALINAYYVGSILYPDTFDDVSIETRADELYETLLGETVYEEVAAIDGEVGPVDVDEYL